MAASLVFCVVAVAAVGGCFGQGACAQELPSVEPSGAAPGETFRLRGGSGGFGAPCNDMPLAREVGSPERDMRVELRQGDRVWRLGKVDARRDYSLHAELTVPESVEPGRATVVIHSETSPPPVRLPLQVLAREPE